MKNDNIKKKIDKLNSSEAIEQTFLSWVQTGLALIGIGFGIGSILTIMRGEHYEKTIIKAIKIIGLFLIFVGFTSIILSLIQHRSKLRELQDEKHKYKYLPNLPLLIGIMIVLLGVAAFLAILIHVIS